MTAFRGQKPVAVDTIRRYLIAPGQIGLELETISELDVNPLIINPEGRANALDALVVMGKSQKCSSQLKKVHCTS